LPAVAKQFQYPIKRSPASDPQQYRVYRMENEAIGARQYMRASKEKIRQLVRSVCRNYGVPAPKLVWCDLGKWAAEWDNGMIRLNTKKGMASDVLTVTHELAHHIHYHLAGRQDLHAAHGPEFMAVHMSILDTCRIIPVEGMRAICARWKVLYCDPGTTCSLPKLRRICRLIRPSSRSA
jgi:predicted SprT family Zn-dependent metalloprotease